MRSDTKWVQKASQQLHRLFQQHLISISANLAQVCECMAKCDRTHAAFSVHKTVNELNALKTSIDVVHNQIRELIDRLDLPVYGVKTETSVNKMFKTIEDMKENATKFMVELSKSELSADSTKYADGFGSVKLLELANELSEYRNLSFVVDWELASRREERHDGIRDLLQKAKYLGLNERWALSSLCLAVQEIAAKNKISKLDGQYKEHKKDEKGNEMNVFRQLQKAYEARGAHPPEILISLASSWTSCRAKLLHEGSRVDKETVHAILEQTYLFLTKIQEN
jgi:hypothetical protein